MPKAKKTDKGYRITKTKKGQKLKDLNKTKQLDVAIAEHRRETATNHGMKPKPEIPPALAILTATPRKTQKLPQDRNKTMPDDILEQLGQL